MSDRAIPLTSESAAPLRRSLLALLSYCRTNDWAGYDPYDALNSRLYQSTPLGRSRVCNLAFTQFLKRIPVNLRPLLGIPQVQNAKGTALFLAALLKLHRLGVAEAEECTALVQRLIALRSGGGEPYWCWGYSFPWQTRGVLVPKGAPNLVCTSFVAHALLDAHEALGDLSCLEMAHGAADYLLKELYWRDGATVGFSYPSPGLRVQVHNANLLGAALLCRVSRLSGDAVFREAALHAARYAVGRQHEDGSWDYGELSSQRWVDHFHTGYNLCALRSIARDAETGEFDAAVRRGYRFYRGHFFRSDGAPRYFPHRDYPVDIHCVAQGILTLLAFRDLDPEGETQAVDLGLWAVQHMWDSRGYFRYRRGALLANSIPYMRWSQAWMLLALAALLEGGPGVGSSARSGGGDHATGTLTPEKGQAASEGTPLPSYVLITPARNEASFIETTIRCMVRQTVLPLRWVIVSDGSTDGTDDIVARYAAQHTWIELLRMPEREERHFAGKVLAFTAGLKRVEALHYEIIGNLDADVSFDEDYFSFLLDKFLAYPRLGVAGTPFTEGKASYDYRFTSIDHVSGQCQLFRRECFEAIGGYLPRRRGGIDLVAVLTAQMQGWQTRTFPGKSFAHHRKMGSGMHGRFATIFKWGEVDYVLGMHPLWECCRCLYQMKNRPYVASGVLRLAGFCWAFFAGEEKEIPPELVRFRRQTQMARLRRFLWGLVPFGRGGSAAAPTGRAR